MTMSEDVNAVVRIIRLTGAEDSSGLQRAIAKILVKVYDQGYEEGWRDAEVREGPS